MIMRTGVFNVSVISEKASFGLFRHFGFQSGKTVDKFADFQAAKRTENGLLAVTEGTNAWLSAKVVQTVDLGTHTMFIADVTDAEVLSDEPSATYAYYQSNIKNAPMPEKKRGGDVRFVDIFMKEKCFRMTLSVQYANMERQILRKSDIRILMRGMT